MRPPSVTPTLPRKGCLPGGFQCQEGAPAGLPWERPVSGRGSTLDFPSPTPLLLIEPEQGPQSPSWSPQAWSLAEGKHQARALA